MILLLPLFTDQIMPAREPKSTQFTTIQITGRNSERKGRLELSSGNVAFYRKSGQTPAIELTYQQLSDLLEREIEYRGIDPSAPLPKGGKKDFVFTASTYARASDAEDMPEYPEFSANGSCSLSKMESHRVEEGRYTIDSTTLIGARPSKHVWHAWISVPFSIAVIGWYIDRWLLGKRAASKPTKDVVLTKAQLRRVLLQLVKRLAD